MYVFWWITKLLYVFLKISTIQWLLTAFKLTITIFCCTFVVLLTGQHRSEVKCGLWMGFYKLRRCAYSNQSRKTKSNVSRAVTPRPPFFSFTFISNNPLPEDNECSVNIWSLQLCVFSFFLKQPTHTEVVLRFLRSSPEVQILFAGSPH